MKPVKKTLSYLLAVVLALGIGLTYAYAVGANDSNAFVTTTEWEAKVAQIRASLDNVRKTINDTNMDYVLNGPRLRVSMIEGYEYTFGASRGSGGWLGEGAYHLPAVSNINNVYVQYNDIYITDRFNGLQTLLNAYWPSSNRSYNSYCPKWRYALRTTTQNYFLVITSYGSGFGELTTFNYVATGTYPLSTTIPARNLTVKLPRADWVRLGDSSYTPTSWSRESGGSYLWAGAVGSLDYLDYTNTNNQNFTISPIYSTRTVDANEITMTYEFPANAYSIRSTISKHGELIPYDIGSKGIKLGSWRDMVVWSPTGSGVVTEVYSPIKGCMCLKSYLNGEIPILN